MKNCLILILRAMKWIVMARLEFLISGVASKQQPIYGVYDLNVSLLKSEIAILKGHIFR